MLDIQACCSHEGGNYLHCFNHKRAVFFCFVFFFAFFAPECVKHDVYLQLIIPPHLNGTSRWNIEGLVLEGVTPLLTHWVIILAALDSEYWIYSPCSLLVLVSSKVTLLVLIGKYSGTRMSTGLSTNILWHIYTFAIWEWKSHQYAK